MPPPLTGRAGAARPETHPRTADVRLDAGRRAQELRRITAAAFELLDTTGTESVAPTCALAHATAFFDSTTHA